MEKTNRKIHKMVLVLSFLLVTSLSSAQLPGFDDSQNDSQPAPITSIVALGLIAGAAYGIKKMRK